MTLLGRKIIWIFEFIVCRNINLLILTLLWYLRSLKTLWKSCRAQVHQGIFAIIFPLNCLREQLKQLRIAKTNHFKYLVNRDFRAAHKIAKVNLKQPNWSYFHNPGSEPLRAVTVGNLLEEAVNKFGDAEALVSLAQNRRLTFHQAKTKVRFTLLLNENWRVALG